MKHRIRRTAVGVELSLDRPEFDCLLDICEAARVYFVQNKLGQFTAERKQDMEQVMGKVFDIGEEVEKE